MWNYKLMPRSHPCQKVKSSSQSTSEWFTLCYFMVAFIINSHTAKLWLLVFRNATITEIWLSASVKCCTSVTAHGRGYKPERAWFLVIWPIKSVLHVGAVWRDSHQTSTHRRKEPRHASQYLLPLGGAVVGTDFTTNFPSLFLCVFNHSSFQNWGFGGI